MHNVFHHQTLQSQLPPKKPPRRNVSMSPVKIGDLSSDAVKSQPRSIDSRKFIQVAKMFSFITITYL